MPSTAESVASELDQLSFDIPDSVDAQVPAEKEAPVADVQSGAAKESESKPEGEPQGSTFDDGLVRQAKSVGFTDEELKSFNSQEHLQASVTALDRKFAELGRQKMREAQQGNQSEQTVTTPNPPAAAQPNTVTGFQPFDFKLDQFEPELAQQLKGFQDHLKSQFETAVEERVNSRLGPVEQVLTAWQQMAQQEQIKANVKWFTDSVQKWDGQWKELFGDKPPTQNSAYAENWQKLADEVDALTTGYVLAGKEIDRDEILLRARRVVFGDKEIKQVKKEVSERLRNAEGQFIAKPGGDKGQEDVRLSPRDRAIRNVATKYSKFFGGESAKEEVGGFLE